MHTIPALRPNPASSAEIVHSYPFPQFYCTTNIRKFCCNSDFHQQKTPGFLLQRIGSILHSLALFLYLLVGFLPCLPFQVLGSLPCLHFLLCLHSQPEFFLFLFGLFLSCVSLLLNLLCVLIRIMESLLYGFFHNLHILQSHVRRSSLFL